MVHGKNIADKHVDINKVRENVGMVFQHFNLFANMTVLRNLTLAPVDLAKERITMVIVTHEMGFAMEVADR